MIEIINNFSTTEESSQLIMYYISNIEYENTHINNIYSFKEIDINLKKYNDTTLSKKLPLNTSDLIRVQLLNNSFIVSNYMHTHYQPWSYVLFLNDDFVGGELIIENIVLTPKKNQLVVFSGNLKHRVNQVTKGNRYTLVSFTQKKEKLNYFLI